jgi:hypothetical protein
MNIVTELTEASGQIQQLLPLIDRAIASGDPAAPMLIELRASIEKNLAEALRLAPLAVAEFEKTEAETEATLAQARTQVAKAEELIAEFDGPRLPPPAPEPLPPRRGDMLAAALLQRYGVHKAAPAQPRVGTDAGDVGALPSGEFSNAEEPTMHPPAPPRVDQAPSVRPPVPGRDVGSITSGEWLDDQ